MMIALAKWFGSTRVPPRETGRVHSAGRGDRRKINTKNTKDTKRTT